MTLPFRVQKRHLLLFYKHTTTFGVDDLSAFTNLNFKGNAKINLQIQFNFHLL